MLDDKDSFHTSSAGAEYIATEGESISYATLKIRSSSAASRKSKFGILSLYVLPLLWAGSALAWLAVRWKNWPPCCRVRSRSNETGRNKPSPLLKWYKDICWF